MSNDNVPPRLLDLVRQEIRVRHCSIRTEQAYVDWVKRFVFFRGKRHPRDTGTEEVRAFLSHLAVSCHVAASTQNQALNALVFLYREVLKQPFADLEDVVRAKKPQRVPVVLTREEVKRLLSKLEGPHWLAACLRYGSGLRLMKCLRLRVKDLDFGHRAVIVRDGKGKKDRVVTFRDMARRAVGRAAVSFGVCAKSAKSAGERQCVSATRRNYPPTRISDFGAILSRHARSSGTSGSSVGNLLLCATNTITANGRAARFCWY